MNGILALWKERGMTSHDCVFKLRRLLQTKKIGHTGTLDPNVDGVLPICVGSATKMVEFMLNSAKEYHGEITLGVATTTEDSTGDIIATTPVQVVPTTEQIDVAMKKMTGKIIQIPPMYSAVKVKGKRLYEYARQNQVVERPKREVEIFAFKRTSEVMVNTDKTVSWTFKVVCSKGTYVRTLAVDLGEQLGYPSHMSQLTRTKSAGIEESQCITLTELEKVALPNRQQKLIPIELAFLDYARYEITDEVWQKVKNGAIIDKIEGLQYPVFLTYQQKIVALYDIHSKNKLLIKPKKMLLGNRG